MMTDKQNMPTQNTEIVIVGGGLAGLSMAAALSSLPVNIVIIEHAASPLNQTNDQIQQGYSPSFDDRALALSLASIKILNNIGVLTANDIEATTPIEHIHVSDKGHLGMLRMSAAEVDEEALGRVIPAPLLGEKLNHYIAHADYPATISLIDQASVTAIRHHAEYATVEVEKTHEHQDEAQEVSQEQFATQVVILADGGRSSISEQLGLLAETTDYQQLAVLANVEIDQSHRCTAYERFTDSGPLALLPLRRNEFKLVWTVSPDKEDFMRNLSDADFLAALQQRFGFRAGRFQQVSRRVIYPMLAKERAQIVHGRVALIGNAAHSLHPIAGQGFNLGLRDIACLAEVLAEQWRLQQQKKSGVDNLLGDLGDAKALLAYQDARQQDIHRTALFTDQLVKCFSTSFKPVAMLRTLGLLALDRQAALKRDLMYRLMGLSGQQFKLLTGQSLLADDISSAHIFVNKDGSVQNPVSTGQDA